MFLKFSKFNQSKYLILSIVGLLVLLAMAIFCNPTISAGTQVINHNNHIIIVYDNNKIQTFTTTKNTVAGALDQVGIKVSKDDHVEPSLSNKLVSDRYYVNIYRARPVLVVDGNNQKIVNTAATSASLIAKAAGINIYNEDSEGFSLNNNDLKKGNIFTMTIKRAKVINLVLYSKSVVMRTQSTDVKGFLKEKNIILDKDDRVSVGLNDQITDGMSFRIWREGKQTITVEEAVPYDIKTVKDYDQYVGYKNIQTAGANGKKEVTYEIIVQDGKETVRTIINSVTIQQPITEVDVIGTAANLTEWLSKLRTCESGGKYSDSTGNGYYGAYQFSITTWNNIAKRSGRIDLLGIVPSQASEADQDAMVVARMVTLAPGGLATQNPDVLL